MTVYLEIAKTVPAPLRDDWYYVRPLWGARARPEHVKGRSDLMDAPRRSLSTTLAHEEWLRDDSMGPEALLTRRAEETVGDVTPDRLEQRRHLRELLGLLDAETRTILWALAHGATQEEIAERIGVSQPTVSVRRRDALQRVAYCLRAPRLTPDDVERALDVVRRGAVRRPRRPLDDVERAVLRGRVLDHRTQSDLATAAGRTQGWVRHLMIAAVAHLEHAAARDPSLRPAAQTFRSASRGRWVMTYPGIRRRARALRGGTRSGPRSRR